MVRYTVRISPLYFTKGGKIPIGVVLRSESREGLKFIPAKREVPIRVNRFCDPMLRVQHKVWLFDRPTFKIFVRGEIFMILFW